MVISFFYPKNRSDGREYKGNWENGKQHGEGIFISPDAEKKDDDGNPIKVEKKGVWENGTLAKWSD